MIKLPEKKLVSIIAPSSALRDADGALDLENSKKELEYILDVFGNKGYMTSFDPDIFKISDLPYFAAKTEYRKNQLKSALENPNVKIISAFRGGYGCSELISEAVKFIPSKPKILIGFSDTTLLHLIFNQNYNFASIHGIINHRYKDQTEQVFSLLEGNDFTYNLTNINQKSSYYSEIQGIVAGGNLCMLCNSIGTTAQLNLKGKILVIEDIGEPGYKLHRYLMHLHNANIIQHAKAVIFAGFNSNEELQQQSIKNFISNYLTDIASFSTKEIGHHLDSRPFILGAKGSISQSRLIINNPFSRS